MVEVDCKMLQVFRNWRRSILHPIHHGSASYGTFSPGPVAEPIVARSSISSVKSLATSTSSLRPSTFTIGSQSIMFEHWRRTISSHHPENAMASSIFSPKRWRPTFISSTRSGLRSNPELGSERIMDPLMDASMYTAGLNAILLLGLIIVYVRIYRDTHAQ